MDAQYGDGAFDRRMSPGRRDDRSGSLGCRLRASLRVLSGAATARECTGCCPNCAPARTGGISRKKCFPAVFNVTAPPCTWLLWEPGFHDAPVDTVVLEARRPAEGTHAHPEGLAGAAATAILVTRPVCKLSPSICYAPRSASSGSTSSRTRNRSSTRKKPATTEIAHGASTPWSLSLVSSFTSHSQLNTRFITGASTPVAGVSRLTRTLHPTKRRKQPHPPPALLCGNGGLIGSDACARLSL